MFKTAMKLTAYYLLLGAVCLFGFMALTNYAQAAEVAVAAPQGLEGALVDIIQQVSGGVKQGVSFLQQEIPDVVKQLLAWKLCEALMIATFCLLLGTGYILLVVKLWNHDYSDDFMPPLLVIGVIFLLGPSLFGVATSTLIALQIYIAPKVWLIEYAASLVK